MDLVAPPPPSFFQCIPFWCNSMSLSPLSLVICLHSLQIISFDSTLFRPLCPLAGLSSLGYIWLKREKASSWPPPIPVRPVTRRAGSNEDRVRYVLMFQMSLLRNRAHLENW